MKFVTVLLSPDEVAECEGYARKRADLHEAAGRGNDRTYRRHYLGVVSEFALAKYVGGLGWWREHSAFKPEAEFRSIAADVVKYQVRSTDQPYGNLLLTDRDRDDAVFVLARVSKTPAGTKVSLVGWITAADGKTYDNREAAHNCPEADYKVSADDLHPMETLP